MRLLAEPSADAAMPAVRPAGPGRRGDNEHVQAPRRPAAVIRRPARSRARRGQGCRRETPGFAAARSVDRGQRTTLLSVLIGSLT